MILQTTSLQPGWISAVRYRAWLVATLARGLSLELTAYNTASARAVATPWVFIAVGESQRPEQATRTIVTGAGNGPVLHITIAAGKNAVPNAQTVMPCDRCQRTIPRSEAAARLQGLSRVSRRSVLSVIAIGLQAANDRQVLSWFH